MIPLLVLLLLHQSWADQVCINISEYSLHITAPHSNITEEGLQRVQCEQDEGWCAFGCTYTNGSWFNSSYDCHNTSVTREDYNVTAYSLEGHIKCYKVQCNETFILPLIKNLGNTGNGQNAMIKLIYLKDSCPDLFQTDCDIKKQYVKLEKQIIHEIMTASKPEAGDSSSHSLKSWSMTIYNISDTDLSVSEATIPIEAPQLLPSNRSFVPKVWMPVDALKGIPQENRGISLVSYTDPSQFRFHEENISSVVLRIELSGERPLRNLMEPIKMIFKVMKSNQSDSQFQCRYFDDKEDGFLWKPDGCETEIHQDNVTCKCNHATPFAVLLTRIPIDEVHWKILSHISYIGCGISLFFSASSLVLYVFNRSRKMDISMCLHVSLSGALFLLNCTFLLTEWGATVELDWVCEFIAALLHYSLLCCFTWMAIEALHLYLLLIKVFNTYYKHYLLKLSLAGWGIPGIIVTTCLCLRNFKQLYGVTQLSMSDTNQTNAICWITDDSFFYSLNLSYFTLVFVFNSGILMAVASSIYRMKRALRANSKLTASSRGKSKGVPLRFSASCQSGLTLLGLTCLMGITWGLAFLGSGYVNYPVLYLFCILNSLQGFFIFLWLCLSAKKQRRREMEEKLSSTVVGTSNIKTD